MINPININKNDRVGTNEVRVLDSKTGEQIMELFTLLNREGKTIVLVTHEKEIADYAPSQIVLRDDAVVEDWRRPAL